MRIVVTGSAGHLGEALVRTLRASGHDVIGLDIVESPFTDQVGSIVDRAFVARCLEGAQAVIHPATLHKPHVVTHSRQDFVDTNITGTLNLLEEAAANGVGAFVFTSTTSVFGHALQSPPGEPAAWITEDVAPIPRNIYGVTKSAAEDLCQLFHRKHGLPCLVLRTSRFFPEEDDSREVRNGFADENAKANEFLFRRVDIEDAVTAHILAMERAPQIGFDRFVISATTPFQPEDAGELGRDAPAVLKRRVPDFAAEYERRGWRMFPRIDRVYVNAHARNTLGWRPRYDFRTLLDSLRADEPAGSALARDIGSKGYHAEVFADGPYPVD